MTIANIAEDKPDKNMAIQKENPSFTTNRAEVYAPIPINPAWAMDMCPEINIKRRPRARIT